MIDKIMPLLGIHRTGMLLGICSNIVKAFDQEFAVHKDEKKIAIDAIIQILTSYKDSISADPQNPTAPNSIPPSS